MHNLLSSVVTNRHQYAECNGAQSSKSLIKCGVPQGSTQGVLLFSLCVNDLPFHTKFNVNLFADDTVLILRSKNINEPQQQSNEELNVINEWMKYNRLSINYRYSKTTYFITQSKHKSTHLNQFN